MERYKTHIILILIAILATAVIMPAFIYGPTINWHTHYSQNQTKSYMTHAILLVRIV